MADLQKEQRIKALMTLLKSKTDVIKIKIPKSAYEHEREIAEAADRLVKAGHGICRDFQGRDETGVYFIKCGYTEVEPGKFAKLGISLGRQV